jgi:glycosyltransferase involved in cell wall biosynthesis
LQKAVTYDIEGPSAWEGLQFFCAMMGRDLSGQRLSGRHGAMRITKDMKNTTRLGVESVLADCGLNARKEVSPEVDRLSMPNRPTRVALMTGGGDRPYALGLVSSLVPHGVALDVIGSDEIGGPRLHESRLVRHFNLRGDTRSSVAKPLKILRILIFYARLLFYATTTKTKVFHILWNNRLELLDRTLLLLYYRVLRKRIVFTAHNVNAGRRDGHDTTLNRLTLRMQYRLVDHLFVHTEKMRQELRTDFGVPDHKISVIPFGVYDGMPNTSLTSVQARLRLGLMPSHKVLVEAMAALAGKDTEYRLLIVGRLENCDRYWEEIQQRISRFGLRPNIIERIEFVPDEEAEIYFKAADVLVLPYTEIFQSGVLLIGYTFGLPVIASDVGSFREDVIEGKTGYLCRARDPEDLAAVMRTYFDGDPFAHLGERRAQIADYARQHYSWATVGEITCKVYTRLAADSCLAGIVSAPGATPAP